MARRGTSVLLIPFLGFLALMYPMATERGTSPAEGGTAQQTKATASPGEMQNSGGENPWHHDREMLDDFLGSLPGGRGSSQLHTEETWPPGDPRNSYEIRFLVATVPDPIDSGLPYLFDRFMSSIQAAVAQDDYVLDSFDMPWLDKSENSQITQTQPGEGSREKTVSDPALGTMKDGRNRRFVTEPGVILFRLRPHVTPDEQTPSVLLVYVVGETPTTGVHKKALEAALQEFQWFCSATEGSNHRVPNAYPKPTTPACERLDVMGPSFTGSVPSLEFTLRSWLGVATKPSVRIISGSATSVATDESFLLRRNRVQLQFSATTAHDSVTTKQLLDYLHRIEPSKEAGCRVAFLVEGNTAYGQSISRPSEKSRDPEQHDTDTKPHDTARAGSKPDECSENSTNQDAKTEQRAPDRVEKADEGTRDRDEHAAPVTIPFPLHISQLRAASEKQRYQLEQASAQPVFRSPLLRLPLEDADERRDSIRALSELDLPSAEQSLASALSTISQDAFHFVGIFATDVRDTMFLAQEVHEHDPSAVLFTVNPDVLYLHPEINPATRGMLIFSSYPLFNANQKWSLSNSTDARLRFPDSASEGVYNATLALLDRPDLLVEYGSPFEFPTCETSKDAYVPPKPCAFISRPPLWISVVGRDGFWPLEYKTGDEQADKEEVADVATLGGDDPQKKTSSPLPYVYAVPVGPDDKAFSENERRALHSASMHGTYPQNTMLAIVLFSLGCFLFCLAVAPSRFGGSHVALTVGKCSRDLQGQSQGSHDPRPPVPFMKVALRRLVRCGKSLLQGLSDSIFLKAFGTAVFLRFRRRGDLLLVVALTSLGFFQFIALIALALPAISLGGSSYEDGIVARVVSDMPWEAILAGAFCIVNLLILASLSTALLIYVTRNSPAEAANEKAQDKRGEPITWHGAPYAAAALFMLVATFRLVANWQPSFSDTGKFSFFAGLRLLNLQSGVSQLLPIFVISMVAFLCSFTSFQRVRLMEHDEGWKGIFCAETDSLAGIKTLEDRVRHYVECPSVSLPGASLLIVGALLIGYAIFEVRLMPAFDPEGFYTLLGVSFTILNIVLWLRVLRFWLIWRELESVLRHLSWHPLRATLKAYRKLFPGTPKIDLATAPGTVASLANSVTQAQAVLQAIRGGGLGATSATTISTGSGAAAAPQVVSVFTPEFAQNIADAGQRLSKALQTQAAGRWRVALCLECDSQRALGAVSKEVTAALEECDWLGTDAVKGKFSSLPKEKCDAAVRASEIYLVTRLVHFLSCVFPQLQSLVYCSAAGLVLMLIAVSCYPLQPRGPLLLFNWVVILMFVGIATSVFVQMNRNVVLSHLNGTEPGRINWDSEFIFRLFFYGVVPILALLGAQFPESVGEIIKRILPASAGHP